jgi:hypothetical protein
MDVQKIPKGGPGAGGKKGLAFWTLRNSKSSHVKSSVIPVQAQPPAHARAGALRALLPGSLSYDKNALRVFNIATPSKKMGRSLVNRSVFAEGFHSDLGNEASRTEIHKKETGRRY